MIPLSALMSSIRSAETGRPYVRLLPLDTISNGDLSASAASTASATSASFLALTTSRAVTSHPRQIAERHAPAMHVHAALLDARVQRRKHLARIEQVVPIERAFQAFLLLQIGFREHLAHQRLLLDADTMLTGENAAHLDAQLQDVGAE